MREKTWEDAVLWLRNQPDQQDLVRDCYFDDPLLASAERFRHSGEWQATAHYLPQTPTTALDLGAGRGISSYALAKDGWQVTALEPDPSTIVGAGAIRKLAKEANLPIRVVEDFGESLPFADHQFDLVMARQVLHHAHDLGQLCREVARVLKPNGVLIATREHVLSKPQDLDRFLAKHALHHLYGGENAFTLAQYTHAITEAGFTMRHVLGAWESEINYFPLTHDQWTAKVTQPVRRRLGNALTRFITDEQYPWGHASLNWLAKVVSQRDNTAGRLYSFVAVKA